MIEGIGFGNISGGFADDKGEFHLPVGFFTVAGNDHVIIRTNNGTGGLEEYDRFGGQFHAAFLRVLLVIEPDAYEFAGARAGRAKAFIARQSGERLLSIQPMGEARRAVRAKKSFSEIFSKGAYIHAGAIFQEHAGFFFAGFANSNQFHNILSNVQGAAIYRIRATGDKGGFVATEENRHGGYFLRLAHAADRLRDGQLLKHLIDVVGIIFLNKSIHKRGVNACGQDGVAADFIFQKIPCDGVCHGEHSSLTGGIGEAVVNGHHADGGGDIDDGTTASFHVAHTSLQAIVHALDVYTEHPVKILLGGIEHIAHVGDAGIINQAINRGIRRDGVEHRLDGRLIGDIACACGGGPTGLGDPGRRRLPGFGIDLEDIDVCALLSEGLGDG